MMRLHHVRFASGVVFVCQDERPPCSLGATPREFGDKTTPSCQVRSIKKNTYFNGYFFIKILMSIMFCTYSNRLSICQHDDDTTLSSNQIVRLCNNSNSITTVIVDRRNQIWISNQLQKSPYPSIDRISYRLS